MDKWFNLNVNASLGEVDIFGEIGGLGVYADDFISEIEAIDFNQEIDFGYAEYLYEKKLLGEYL